MTKYFQSTMPTTAPTKPPNELSPSHSMMIDQGRRTTSSQW